MGRRKNSGRGRPVGSQDRNDGRVLVGSKLTLSIASLTRACVMRPFLYRLSISPLLDEPEDSQAMLTLR